MINNILDWLTYYARFWLWVNAVIRCRAWAATAVYRLHCSQDIAGDAAWAIKRLSEGYWVRNAYGCCYVAAPLGRVTEHAKNTTITLSEGRWMALHDTRKTRFFACVPGNARV